MTRSGNPKEFFSDKNTRLFDNAEYTKEVERRVGVFREALSKFHQLHEIFSEAVKETILNVKPLDQYIQEGAQGYVGELLFLDSNKKINSAYEYSQVTEDIRDILSTNRHPVPSYSIKQSQKKIEKQLLDMLQIAYPNGGINSLESDVKNLVIIQKIIDIFVSDSKIIDRNWDLTDDEYKPYTSLEELGFEVELIQKKYLEEFHAIYISLEDGKFKYSWPGAVKRIERKGDRRVSKEHLDAILSNVLDLINKLQYLSLDESHLRSKGDEIIHTLAEDGTIDTKKVKSLKEELQQHIRKYEVFYARVDSKNNTRTLEKVVDLQGLRWNDLVYKIAGIECDANNLHVIGKDFLPLENVIKYDKIMGSADMEAILKNKEIYGAKAVFLDEIVKFISKLETDAAKYNPFHFKLTVPKYVNVEIEQYKYRLKNSQLNIGYFKSLYSKFEGKDIIVRSSAVYSEDNENITGAGVYHSEDIKKSTFEDFCKAVEKVYISCNSEDAVIYRKKHNIPVEYMGLIVQEYIRNGNNGTANSVIPARPDLLQVYLHGVSGFRPIFIKDELLKRSLDKSRGTIHHHKQSLYFYQIDRSEHAEYSRDGHTAGILTLLLERYFKKPIQVEFNSDCSNGSIHESNFWPLQVRILPSHFKERKNIEFPEEGELLWRGRAIGTCDGIYNILGNNSNNRNKVGVVSFVGNHQASFKFGDIKKALPKEGAVIIKRKSGDCGHIETLCIEDGVPCLFDNTGYERLGQEVADKLGVREGYYFGNSLYPENFYGYSTVRVVVNGLEGRVYGVEICKGALEPSQKIQELKEVLLGNSNSNSTNEEEENKYFTKQ